MKTTAPPPRSFNSAITNLLAPRTVAVIGVSRERGAIGSALFGNILGADFAGNVFPVNPNAAEIQGVRAYRSIEEVPGQVDLGIICIPASGVARAAAACAAQGVRALIVISSGFAEIGADGAAMQRELDSICIQHNMLLIGPNCMGVANTAPHVRLNATFGPTGPAMGALGFLTQSGAVGLAVIESINISGVGFSSYLSVGNSAGLPIDELLEFWEHDPATKVIGMYLEGIPSPAKFITAARRISRNKPIIALKAGRFSGSQRAASSHTAALTSQSDAVIDYALASAGITRADTVDDLINQIIFYSSLKAPIGPRVCIITNGGGAGIICADQCEYNELTVPEPPSELNEALNKIIPHCGSSRNPIDLLAMASSDLFREVIKTVLDSRQYDAIIIIYLDPIANNQEHIPQMLITFLPDVGGDIPICITVVPTSTSDRHESYVVNELPIFPTPEAPAKCLAAALKSSQARSRSELRPRSIPIDTSMITEERMGWLVPSEVEELLKRNKLPILDSFEAQSPKEAQQIATKLGSLVAIRASGPNIIHKTELGAIRLNISQEQAELAANQISVHLQKHYGITPAFFTVQRMVQPGIELFIGINRDPYLGPVIAFGAGGVNVEIFKDLKFAIPPINRDIIYKLLSELRIFPLLLGHRGAARSRIDSFIEMIEIICSLSLECTRISEIDLNPILLSPNEALIIDARIRVIRRTEAQGDPSLVHRS